MPVPGKIGARNRPHRRNQRKPGQATRPVRPTPIQITSVTPASPSANQITLAFDQPVFLGNTPKYALGDGVTPTNAHLASPTTLVLTYAAPVQANATVRVPFDNGSVRNTSGGYVNPGTYAAGTVRTGTEETTQPMPITQQGPQQQAA